MPSWTGSIRRGKYVEATEIAKRLLANREKGLGPEHPGWTPCGVAALRLVQPGQVVERLPHVGVLGPQLNHSMHTPQREAARMMGRRSPNDSAVNDGGH